MTGVDGRFSLMGLAAGRYTVRATSEAGEGEAPDVATGRSVDILVATAAELSGVARDARGAAVTSFVLSAMGRAARACSGLTIPTVVGCYRTCRPAAG